MTGVKPPLKQIFRQRWLTVLLLLIIFTVNTGLPAAAQEPTAQQLTVVAPALNVRSGPATTFAALTYLSQGQQVEIISYDATHDWWQIQLPDGTSGWVSGGPEYISVAGDIAPTSPTIETAAPQAVPQSSHVVFQTHSGGPIYAVAPDGSNLRYLATGLDPVLSPDGQQVAFTRWNTSQDGALGSLWLINIDGSNERAIHHNVFNPRTPVWSPDGSQIAIAMQQGGWVQPRRTCGDQRPPRNAYDISIEREGFRIVGYCYTEPPDPHWALRQVDVASGAGEDLPNQTYSLSPAWDPANSWRLIYDGDRGLVSLDLNKNTATPFTSDFNDHSPVFSPDGTRIALTYRQDDHWEVHVLNNDGSGRMRLTQTSYQELVRQQLAGEPIRAYHSASPSWSPDGSQIAFLTDRTGAWEIWVMQADGSNQRPLFPPELLGDIELQYNGVDEQMLTWR